MAPVTSNFSGMLLPLLFILSINVHNLQASAWDTANIAVVEYQPVSDPTLSPDQRIMQNALRYVGILESVNSTNLDMIVFPEATLRDTPETSVAVQILDNPCTSTTHPQFLKDLSCAARDSQTYLVINLIERSKCDQNDQSANCQNFGFRFYNTDVIFDRRGTIIGKYHKYNLFKEHELDKPLVPENVTFRTDFGLKFGIFTCFDILFKSPAQDLLGEKPDGIIFPSMWFSELPFLTALQTQQMWAYAHQIPLFGAGANDPRVGSGGSGIYAGSKRTVQEGIVAEGGSKVWVSGGVGVEPRPDVDDLGREMDAFQISSDSTLPGFSHQLLALDLETNQRVCSNDLCCSFTAHVQQQPPNSTFYTYFLVAFSGIRSFAGAYNGGLEICGIIACLNSSFSSCGRRFPKYGDISWPLTFRQLTIEAEFQDGGNRTQYPNSLLSSIRPIDARETAWSWEKAERGGKNYTRRRFALTKAQNRILTFAIYGRYFDRDFPERGGASSHTYVTWGLVFCVAMLLYLRPINR